MSNPKFKAKKFNLEIVKKERSDISLDCISHENNGWSSLIKAIVVPLKSFFRKYKTTDLYTGTEEIPFEKIHPEFKEIMKEEVSIKE